MTDMRTQPLFGRCPVREAYVFGFRKACGGSVGQSNATGATDSYVGNGNLAPGCQGTTEPGILNVAPRCAYLLKVRAATPSPVLSSTEAVDSGKIASPSNTVAYVGKIAVLLAPIYGWFGIHARICPAERGSVCQTSKHVALGILADFGSGCQDKSGHVDASLRLSAALVPLTLRVGRARPVWPWCDVHHMVKPLGRTGSNPERATSWAS